MADDPNPHPGNITDAMWWLWAGGMSVLEPDSELGGIYAFKSGFHNTRNANQTWWPLNYSIRDPINQQGPDDKAAAIDWTFPEAQRGDYRRINLYSARLDAASRARDPRLRGWFEWFGTRDGANIGWNIYENRFSSSDDSHDWHLHLSEIRAYVQSRVNKEALLSVLRGESLADYLARGGQLIDQGDDMLKDETLTLPREVLLTGETVPSTGTTEKVDAATAVAFALRHAYAGRRSSEESLKGVRRLEAAAAADEARDNATRAALEALAEVIRNGGGDPDVTAILARVDAAKAETQTLIVERHQVEMAKLEALHAEALREREARIAALEAELDALTAPAAE